MPIFSRRIGTFKPHRPLTLSFRTVQMCQSFSAEFVQPSGHSASVRTIRSGRSFGSSKTKNENLMVTQNRKSFIVRSGRSFGYSVPVRPFRSDRLNWFGRSISRLHSHECPPYKSALKNGHAHTYRITAHITHPSIEICVLTY